MSDHFIIIIPKDPAFVPADAGALDALARQLAPRADRIEVADAAVPQFHDAGGNHADEVGCPRCGAIIGPDEWAGMMDEDFSQEQRGFTLNQHVLACGHRANLNDLVYRWPEGFSRWSLCIKNPDRGPFSADEVARLAAAMGCEVTIILRHL